MTKDIVQWNVFFVAVDVAVPCAAYAKEFMNVGAISACHHWDFAVHLLELTCEPRHQTDTTHFLAVWDSLGQSNAMSSRSYLLHWLHLWYDKETQRWCRRCVILPPSLPGPVLEDLHLQPGHVAFGATIGACSKANYLVWQILWLCHQKNSPNPHFFGGGLENHAHHLWSLWGTQLSQSQATDTCIIASGRPLASRREPSAKCFGRWKSWKMSIFTQSYPPFIKHGGGKPTIHIHL